MRSALAIFTALALTLSPAAALAKKDHSNLSAAEYEAKQIAEGKAKGGMMLSPAPEPGGASAEPGPPPGAPGVPVVQPVAPPPPAELSGPALIAALVIAVAGIALFVDIRRTV